MANSGQDHEEHGHGHEHSELSEMELRLMRVCRVAGLPYPEHCLLGVYRKPLPG